MGVIIFSLLYVFFMVFSLFTIEKEILLEVNLFLFSNFYFSLHLIADYFSLGFFSTILLISLVVLFYSFYYMNGDYTPIRFFILVMLFIGSIGLLVLSPSLLGLICGWDGLGITSFLLVIYYNNTVSLRSGIVTIYTNRLGDVFIVFSFFIISRCGWLRLERLFFKIRILCVFILLAGVTRRAQLPFSSWLPAAIAAPTPVSSLVHSSTLVTAGIYLFIRFYYIITILIVFLGFLLVSLLTIMSAGLIACLEVDLKKLVAISTLRQLGIIMFIISLGNLFYCFFHLVNHALFKSLLFLSCGYIILLRAGGQDMRFMGDKFNYRKSIYLILCLSVIRLIGFPFFSGFFSKDISIELIFFLGVDFILIALFIMSCFLSIFYSFKLIVNGGYSKQIGNSFQVNLFSRRKSLFIGILFFWAISFGKFNIFILISGESYVIFFYEKTIGVFLLLLVGFFYYFFIKRGGVYLFSYLIFNMLHLNWYFGGFVSSLRARINILIKGEYFWVELVSVKNTIMIINLSSNMLLFYKSPIKITFLLLIVLLILLLSFLLFSLE